MQREKEILLEGARTITELRRRNEILEARCDTLDLLAALLRISGGAMGQGYPDPAEALVEIADSIPADPADD